MGARDSGLPAVSKTSYLCRMERSLQRPVIAWLLWTVLSAPCFSAEVPDKETTIREGSNTTLAPRGASQSPGGGGYRFDISQAGVQVPVAVVHGTPYQRGWHFGHLMKVEAQQFVPAVLAGFQKELGITSETLDQVWASTSAFTDDRFEQELVGLSEGAALPIRSLQHLHCLPLLMPYSCSSIAAWGSATSDGHLYQTRNLDWTLKAGAHEFPVLAIHIPDKGEAHVLPTFAGVLGANCGMNASGIVLAEMGDSSRAEMPYTLLAPHFTTWFRTVLQDATSLGDALDIFKAQPQTKRYHFVFGDGKTEKRAVKILAHTVLPESERLRIWRDNDPKDELAPNVLQCVVYQDEGRGAFPTLKQGIGKLDADKLIRLANQIPIRGGNVLNAVFDATALRIWVSYAHGETEAFQRPYVHLDLTQLDNKARGMPAFESKSGKGH